ncbi:MAG: VOC family protein [Pseudomonadota bacterium]
MANAVDHVLYACSDLERGRDEIEQLLGVRPVIGGRHERFGTHNALLSLGPGAYLEVVARDPALPVPAHGLLVDVAADQRSRLITWVLRVDDIGRSAEAAERAGLGLGAVEPGQRETPDGKMIRWRLTDPYANRRGGALPFLIDWGDTPHPSSVAPDAGRLDRLVIETPDAAAIRDACAVLDADVDVREGPTFGLRATIATPSGPVELC